MEKIMELVAEIVAGQSNQRVLSAGEIAELIRETYRALKEIEAIELGDSREGEYVMHSMYVSECPPCMEPEQGSLSRMKSRSVESHPPFPPAEPSGSWVDSIGDDWITCLECEKNFRQLTHTHLHEHGMTPDDYRRKYGVPARQPLAARSVTEARKSQAGRVGLGDRLRIARMMKRAAGPSPVEPGEE